MPHTAPHLLPENQIIATVSHQEFKAFAKEQMAKEGGYKKFFTIALLVTAFGFSASAGYATVLFFVEDVWFYLLQIGLGFLFSLSLLLIIHELLHGIAYKIVGAKKVYFGAVLSQFVFYAGSDQEEFNGRKFRLIAIFPFAVITGLGLLSLLLFPQYFFFTLTALFFHTLFCSGDFAILNFMQQYDLDQIHTSDSKSKEETYYYLKPSQR